MMQRANGLAEDVLHGCLFANLDHLRGKVHARSDDDRFSAKQTCSIAVRIYENTTRLFKNNLIGGDIPWPLFEACRVIVVNGDRQS